MRVGRNKGFKVGPLPKLRSLWASWLKVQEKYGRELQWRDATWLYNERASLSALAAAAWDAGGIALEEFSTDKVSLGRRSRRPTHGSVRGRCDLYVSLHGREFLIEAKLVWPSLRGTTIRSRLQSAMTAALGDVKRNTTYYGLQRLGVVLIAPTMPERYTGDADALVARFVDTLCAVERCAAAWIFPQPARTAFKLEGKFYPGAAILMKPLRTSRQTRRSSRRSQ